MSSGIRVVYDIPSAYVLASNPSYSKGPARGNPTQSLRGKGFSTVMAFVTSVPVSEWRTGPELGQLAERRYIAAHLRYPDWTGLFSSSSRTASSRSNHFRRRPAEDKHPSPSPSHRRDPGRRGRDPAVSEPPQRPRGRGGRNPTVSEPPQRPRGAGRARSRRHRQVTSTDDEH